MTIYSKASSLFSHFYAGPITVALSLPFESNFFQLLLTFPFNILVLFSVILVVWTIRLFTKKPNRINRSVVDVETPTLNGEKNDFSKSFLSKREDITTRPTEIVVEEIPRDFKGSREGIISLYNWFYKFAKINLVEIDANMTPQEFLTIVSSKLPSKGIKPLEYLVRSCEIANYSKIEPTNEMNSKCLESVELLKALIEGDDSNKDEEDIEHIELSAEIISQNVALEEN
jgi:hypothetical protein